MMAFKMAFKEVEELSLGTQSGLFEREWKIGGKKVWIEIWNTYARSPYWCERVRIGVYVEDRINRCVLSMDIPLKIPGSERERLAEINIDVNFIKEEILKKTKNKIKEIIHDIDFLKNSCFLPTKRGDLNILNLSNERTKFLEDVCEALHGYSDEEINKIEEKIKNHNLECAKHRANNPYSAISLLLKPGLASILGEKRGLYGNLD